MTPQIRNNLVEMETNWNSVVCQFVFSIFLGLYTQLCVSIYIEIYRDRNRTYVFGNLGEHYAMGLVGFSN